MMQNNMTERWNNMTERQQDFFGQLGRRTAYSFDTLVWALDHIDAWFDENEGRDVYGSDLGFEITLNENNNGFVDDPYTYTAKEWIKAHFDDCAVYWEYEKDNYGSDGNKVNPFDEPVTYQVLVYINAVEQIMSSLPYVEEHWNDDITLTPDAIARLRYELCMSDDCPADDGKETNEDEEMGDNGEETGND